MLAVNWGMGNPLWMNRPGVGFVTLADMSGLHTDFLLNMSASADVLAQAKVEIALNSIPEGKNVRYYPYTYTPPHILLCTFILTPQR